MEIKKQKKTRLALYFKHSAGFTLMETLVALAALGVILTVVVSTFVTVLTKSAKIRVAEAVESNGKYALRTIERMIKGSRRVVESSIGTTCELDMDVIRIEDVSGNWSEFSCLREGLGNGYIASSSAEGDKRLTSPQVKLDDCCFHCFSSGVNQPDRVEISFTLSQQEVTSRVEEQASTTFQSSVTLRNY